MKISGRENQLVPKWQAHSAPAAEAYFSSPVFLEKSFFFVFVTLKMSGTVSFPSPAFPLCLCDQLTPWELSSPFSISLVLPAGVSIAAPVAAPLWRKEEKSSLAGSGEDFANGMPGEGRLYPCRTKRNSAKARPTQPCHGERGKTFSYATEEENCGIAFRPSFLSSTFFLAHLRTRKSTGRKEVDEKGSKYMV